MNATAARPRYPVNETNNIADAAYTHEALEPGVTVLADRRLVKIDRLRLLTDPGCPFFDVSYVYGTLADGTHVRVDLGRDQFPRQGLSRALVQCAKDAGRYAKGLGMLDNSVLSILR